MWNLVNVYQIFPGEKRHDRIVLMSVEVYLADGLAFSIAKQQKYVVNTWMDLHILLQATCWGLWQPSVASEW